MLTKDDLMKLSKERLCELLLEEWSKKENTLVPFDFPSLGRDDCYHGGLFHPLLLFPLSGTTIVSLIVVRVKGLINPFVVLANGGKTTAVKMGVLLRTEEFCK